MYIDRQMDAAGVAAFEEHQNCCDACRQEYRRFSDATEKLACWINSTNSLICSGTMLSNPDAALAAHCERPPEPRTLHWPVLDWVVAVAAAVLLAVGVSQWLSGVQPIRETAGKTVAEDSGPPKKAPLPDAGPSDEEIKKVLARELPRLSLNDFKEREEAQAAIVRLGVKAKESVHTAQKIASDPEVRSRLEAVLQAFVLIEEDTYALAQLKKGGSFPRSQSMQVSADARTVAEALLAIERQSNVKIEIYPKDKALIRMAEAAQMTASASFVGSDAAEQALALVLNTCDATFVLDEGKVVVVRMTPDVFFAKFEQQTPLRHATDVDDRIAQFDGKVQNHWLTVMRFLQIKFEQGDAARKKWVDVLIGRAEDTGETDAHRALALKALQSFLGLGEKEQPDVDGEFIGYAGKPTTPAPIRRAALGGLILGMSEAAQGTVLRILESGDEAGQLDLLQAIVENGYYHWSGMNQILNTDSKRARFFAAIRKVSKSGDPELAVRALSVLATHGDTAAIGALADAPKPKDLTTIRMFIEALSRRDNVTGAPIVRGNGRERLDSYAKDESAEVRAIYACRMGFLSGGPERLPDVEGLRPLLNDPSPLVRGMSVHSLGVTYSASAATPFRDKLAEIRSKLSAMKKTEQDPRVLREIDASLKGIPED